MMKDIKSGKDTDFVDELIFIDTLDWEQVCDFGGLNSEVAKQYSIYKIPANILLSSDGKILAKNLRGEELKKKIENIVEEATEKEKKNKQKK